MDGQPVSAGVTNPAFINKNQPDSMPYTLGLTSSTPSDGPSITSAQAQINALGSYTGTPANSAYNVTPTWTNNDLGFSSDSVKARADVLTQRFNNISGHAHSGADGQGATVVAGSIGSVPLMGYAIQGTDLTGVTGNTTNVSTQLAGSSPSAGTSSPGVVVTVPYNKVIVRNSANDNEYHDVGGNVVYARVTFSSGVWTLTYYSEVSGTETGYTFSGSNGVRWYYQTLQSPLSGLAPVYSPLFNVPSDNATADVVDMVGDTGSGGQRGLVPAPPPGSAAAGDFLKADGTWAVPPGTGPGGYILPTQQAFFSGSGTYTTPTSPAPLYIRVRMVGGGGGGSGGGLSPTDGTDGTDTTFGTSLLTAGHGFGSLTAGGGTTILNSPAFGTGVPGGEGGASMLETSTNPGSFQLGGMGGSSYYGGAGGSGNATGAGRNGAANTGGGGGGGGGFVAQAGNQGGYGGGSGAFIDAIINSPAATYSFNVGTGGTGGAGGGGAGQPGGNGGSGYIEVTEFYGNASTGTATNVTGVVQVNHGGTGSATADGARANLAKAPIITTLTSGSGTYTVPTSPAPIYLRVRMVGGGGGGGGSATIPSGPNAGGTGGTTTFGTSFLIANGGGGSGIAGSGPGAGGPATPLPGGTSGLTLVGGGGVIAANINGSLTFEEGGAGGSSAFGGGGTGAGGTNTGGGGSGAGVQGTGAFTAAGGGSGAFVDALITSGILASYAYSVGAAGAHGLAGGGGFNGNDGGSGVIEITEYYM